MSCKPLKISEMPGVHCLRPSDLLPIVRDGENRALTLDQLFHTFKELLPPPPHHGGDCLEAIRKACDALALANKALMAADQSYRIARDSWDLANTNKEAIVEINSQICEILLRLDALEQDEGSKITIITNETDPKQIVYTFKDNNEIIATVTVPKFATDLTAEDLSNMIPDAEAIKIAFSNVNSVLGDRVVDGAYVPPTEGLLANTTSFSQADEVLAQAIGEAGNFNVEYSDYVRNNMNNSRGVVAKEALVPIATIIKGEQQTVLYAPYGDKVTFYPPVTSKGLNSMPDGGVIASIGIKKAEGYQEEIYPITIPNKLSSYRNDIGYQTFDDVDTAIKAAINNLINGAGAQLDTLKELADALNNDANFATTVTNLINEKYTKPEGGIPASDLAQEVQTSLGKADTALQPGDADLNVLEGVKLNGNTLPINDKMVDITIPAGTLSQTYEANRTNTPVAGGDTYEEAIAKLDGIIINNEEVTAASLNDLNDKKANKSELADVAFSGDYHDLINTPTIPDEFIQQQVDWNATSGVTSIANKPNLATVATSGDYNDLANRPSGNYIENKAGSASPYTTTINAANNSPMQNPAQLTLIEQSASLEKRGNILTVAGENGISVEISQRNFPDAKFTYNGNEVATKSDFKTINGESIIGSGNIEIEPGGGGTVDNIKVNDVLGSVDENKIASVTVTGADVDVTGFTESEATNEGLIIQPTDSVNDALGKLQKAIKDDEAVHTTAFNAIKNATGFTTELEYQSTTDEGLAIYGARDLSDADEKLAAAINNIKTLHEKVNLLNIVYRQALPTAGGSAPQTTYNPHYTGSSPVNRTITLLGEDLLNLTRLMPPTSWIDVQTGETDEYYTLTTASRTIAEKSGGILPMNPGIIYTWLENGLWVAYQYVGIDDSAVQFRNTDNWIKRW